MFFLVAVFLVSLVLSVFLTPKPKITDAVSGKLNDFNFPRANYGAPVPRIYGTVKFKAPNTIWSGDFAAIAIKKKVKTGLFSSKQQTIGYKYSVGFDLAVCLGPGFVFRRLWAGTYELWNGCLSSTNCENTITINLPELFGGQDKGGGFVAQVGLYCGGFDQSRDPYLAAKVDPNVPAYVGIAHMVFRGVPKSNLANSNNPIALWLGLKNKSGTGAYIGNQTSLQPIYVEGAMFTNSLGSPFHIMGNGLDANPVEVLYDLQVNDWGNLNVSTDLIDVVQWRAVAKTIFDENNGISIVVGNASKGGDLAKEILSQINATIFEDPATGKFQLVLIREDYDIDDLPVLGPGEIMKLSNFTKMLWADTYNRIRVKYTDRANGFQEDAVALAEDFANIRFQGAARSFEVTFNGVYEAQLANDLAARELSNVNVPLYSCELTLDRLAANLRPGSPFVLNWPEYGIEQLVCRIRKFGLGTLQDGTITASVVQDRFSVNATVIAPPSASTYTPPDYSPKPITDYTLFELPYLLDRVSGTASGQGNAKIAVFASAPSGASAVFNAFIVGTPDDAEVLEAAEYTNSAKLAEALPRFGGFVAAVVPTLTIDTLVQGGENFPLLSGSEAAARTGQGLFMLNGEFLAYEDFADNEDGTFSLLNVHRALLDTAWHGGAIGDVLYFFDGQEGFYDDEVPIGIELQTYLQDVSAGGNYPVADAARIAFTPAGRAALPLPADALALDGERASNSRYVPGAAPLLTFAGRDALSDPTAIDFEGDAPEAAAGVTYALDIADAAGKVLASVDPFASGDAVPLPADYSGAAVLRLWSKRDGLASFEPAEYPLLILPPAAVTIDGEQLTIDAAGVEIDA